eukprot:Anaeramoba_ignava/a374281_14.p1 GENE.a374281_14~~a374281_14.p1  ORF type:complete len:108 (+),score=12.75 a374281_14:17-340(+)
MRKNKVNSTTNNQITSQMTTIDSNLEILHQIAATINHEINNPLTSIIGQAEISEIAAENGMEETLKKSLRNIILQAERIRNITQKLESLEEITTEDYAGYTKILSLT